MTSAGIVDQPVAVPALHHHLAPALGLAPPDVVPPVRGPRLWWAGPLDVEGLALGSVQAALTAANALLGHPSFAVDARRVGAWFDSLRQLRVDGRAPVGFAALSGFFACADGFVRLHGNYPHHAAAIARALGTDDPAALTHVVTGLSATTVEDRVRGGGGVAAAVRTTSAWLASPMGRAVDATPWIRFAGAAPAGPDYEPLTRPLDDLTGLRVLDMTTVIAGPTAGRLLALLGADVLRVDPPHRPELLDQHLDTSFGKRTALADLADAAGLARVRELLDTADVLLTAYRPGALARFGLDAATLRSDHPGLAVVEINAWGDRGPWGRARGFDSIVQAAVGIADIYASRDADGMRRPGALPVQALDHATGYAAAAAALALVHRRLTQGQAGTAQISLAGTAHVLLRLPGADPGRLDLPPAVGELDSVYGRLSYASPAVVSDGRHLDYPGPPRRYGLDPLSWTPDGTNAAAMAP